MYGLIQEDIIWTYFTLTMRWNWEKKKHTTDMPSWKLCWARSSLSFAEFSFSFPLSDVLSPRCCFCQLRSRFIFLFTSSSSPFLVFCFAFSLLLFDWKSFSLYFSLSRRNHHWSKRRKIIFFSPQTQCINEMVFLDSKPNRIKYAI